MSSTDPTAAALDWITADPDPATRAELQGLVDAGAHDELTERMAGALEFGTAGLRGRVEAGSNRMNRAVVIRTTRGLADYLHDTTGAGGTVAVGRDARLSSEVFMEDTISVLLAAGFDVRYFAAPTPTPLVAYAAKHLGAVAAIVITASHNPPADNGYKVYAANAAQIVSPVDQDIAAAIDRVGPAIDVPRQPEPYSSDRAVALTSDTFDDYLHEVAASLPAVTGDRSLRMVYTAMHGVGGKFVLSALEHFGFPNVHPVAKQFEPDGRFPTVGFPNPEEPGALDLAHDLASSLDADLVIANDPDTDRLAVSLAEPDGGFRQLSGNQIGVLLAEFILGGVDVHNPIVMNSIVSSPMLAAVAAQHGALYDRTLTGFKWICNAALDLEAEGRGQFVFGYEEALGYSVGRTVRDKDGISAAVAFAALAAVAKANGETVWDRLGALYRRDGLWVSTQQSIVRTGTEGAAEIAAAMERVGRSTPERLGRYTVSAVSDYREGASARPRYLGATPLVELTLGESGTASSGRALVRPSGTEPKLKIYVDLREEVDGGHMWRDQEAHLLGRARAVAVDLVGFLGF